MIHETVSQVGIKSKGEPVENPGAMQFGPVGEVDLPDDLISIYEIGDAIRFENFPGAMIPYATSKARNNPAFEPAVYDAWPFFLPDDRQSDPVCVIVNGPAKGYVMHQAHDGFDRMLAPDVASFFQRLLELKDADDPFDEEEPHWFFPRPQNPEDAAAVEALLTGIDHAEDDYEAESLTSLAMSMMDDEAFTTRFATTLFPIENFRAVIWGRLLRIDSDEARAGVELYKSDYEARSKR